MSTNPITIPEDTSHFYTNAKNKPSFYSNKVIKDGWCIYNKGLEKWEKIPSLQLTLKNIESFLEESLTEAQTFTSVFEETSYDIVNVTMKSTPVVEKHADDFRKPPLSLGDFLYVIELFEKYSDNTLQGFVPNLQNYSVYYSYKENKWKYCTSTSEELLTVYTTSLQTIEQVLKELNETIYKGITNG